MEVIMDTLFRRSRAGFFPALLLGLAACSGGNEPAAGPQITVHKHATCSCCSKWIAYLKKSGFAVKAANDNDDEIAQLHRQFGVGDEIAACHTGVIEGYVVEGHVPAEDIKRLLVERPKARGLVLPGMPVGSPGMEQGNDREPYDVLLLQNDGSTTVFASHE